MATDSTIEELPEAKELYDNDMLPVSQDKVAKHLKLSVLATKLMNMITTAQAAIYKAVSDYLDSHPVSALSAGNSDKNMVPTSNGDGTWSWKDQIGVSGSVPDGVVLAEEYESDDELFIEDLMLNKLSFSDSDELQAVLKFGDVVLGKVNVRTNLGNLRLDVDGEHLYLYNGNVLLSSVAIPSGGSGEAILCTGVSIDAELLSMDVGTTQMLSATVTPINTTQSLNWYTENENVAVVINGLITAVADGTTRIIAACGNFSDFITVTVTDPTVCKSITIISPDVAYGTIGRKLQYTANIMPATATQPVVWSSLDTSVATIDQNGLVTVVGAGVIKISATCGAATAEDSSISAIDSRIYGISIRSGYALNISASTWTVYSQGTRGYAYYNGDTATPIPIEALHKYVVYLDEDISVALTNGEESVKVRIMEFTSEKGRINGTEWIDIYNSPYEFTANENASGLSMNVLVNASSAEQSMSSYKTWVAEHLIIEEVY